MNMVSDPKNWAAFYLGAIAFRILQKEPDPNKAADVKVSTDDMTEQGRIRCPLCSWRPKASSRWYCASAGSPEFYPDGCGTCWNTFDTRGKCPGCGHEWRWTTCLACHGHSLHEEWYRKGAE